jgi:hypothetical protein
MAKSAINIRPGVGILGLFPAMNYKAWYALGELVDNALDSYIVSKKRLRKAEGSDYRLIIDILVESADGGFIRVWDNAAGINVKNYQRAFVTAEPPTDSAGLSQFGIGMKSASCWFAREWRVTSTALDEDTKRTVEFDVPRIVKQNIEQLVATTEKARPEEHSTEVRLWNLYKPPQTRTIAKMRSHLASMYRQFLRSGEVEIRFNHEPLEYETPAILVAPPTGSPNSDPVTWKKEIDFRLSSGEHVTGWAGIREKGSTKYSGLALFSHNRLIVGSDDETYRPPEIFGGTNSFRYQRVIGELHLDDLELTHTKDGFIWGERESEFLDRLRAELDSEPLPLLRQADQYRAREASSDLKAEATKAVERTATALVEAEPIIEDQVEAAPLSKPPPRQLPPAATAGRRVLDLAIKGELWEVTLDLMTDPAATEWVQIVDAPKGASSKTRKLGIRVSLSHPFTQRFGGATADDIEGLIRIAAGLAIAETTARESGVQMAGTIRRNLNELLSTALSKP